MAFVPKDNTAVLFKNDRKEKETHPDYKGSALVDGNDYWLAAWVKDGQRGKFFSMSLTLKDDQLAQAAPEPQGTPGGVDLDDQIPFAPCVD